MSRTLTAADRSHLIRLAASLDKGSPERKALLAGLQKQAGPGEVTMWASDGGTDFIIAGEHSGLRYWGHDGGVAEAVEATAEEIGKASGGSYRVGNTAMEMTSGGRGFRFGVQLRVTGVPLEATVEAIKSKARGAREVPWRKVAFAKDRYGL